MIGSSRAVLDVAPTPQIESFLQRLCTCYVRMDRDPAADRRSVDVQASLTAAPFPDRTFDVILCYHVLEHVPDDAAAMRELRRLLSPGGFALVQVPWHPDAPTDEDPDAPPDERVRRFGQVDHVRAYGRDFEDRLLAAGLDVTRMTPGDVLGETSITVLGLNRDESVWIVRPSRPDTSRPTGSSHPADVDPATVRLPGTALRLTLARQIEPQYEQTARLRAQLQSAERAAERYHQLRRLPPVRFLAAVTRPLRHRHRPRRTSLCHKSSASYRRGNRGRRAVIKLASRCSAAQYASAHLQRNARSYPFRNRIRPAAPSLTCGDASCLALLPNMRRRGLNL